MRDYERCQIKGRKKRRKEDEAKEKSVIRTENKTRNELQRKI